MSRSPSLHAPVLACSLLLVASGALALLDEPGSAAGPRTTVAAARAPLPDRSSSGAEAGSDGPSTSVAGAAQEPLEQVASPRLVPTPPDPLDLYRGMGAWVDLYDYGNPGNLSPEQIVDEMSGRGVRTIFLQTSRWNLPADVHNPAGVSAFLNRSKMHGIRVVGWYFPGFGDIERDLRSSLAVFGYQTPEGVRFDGFAPDIEDRRGVGKDVARFNAGLIEYSVRLRASVPPGTVIGGIVVDAKNNERAPMAWAGFPWPEMAQNYDVILPMAYWTVTKRGGCPTFDAGGYVREVVAKTQALMGVVKPVHVIGGIADCMTAEEMPGFIASVRETGSIGGSLYDFDSHHKRADRDYIWSELLKLNQP